jgi:hypothetical protein
MIQECLAIGDDLDGLDAEIEDRVATKELAARGRRIRFLGGISICLMALVTVALVLGLISRLRAGRLSDRSRTIWGGSYSCQTTLGSDPLTTLKMTPSFVQ